MVCQACGNLVQAGVRFCPQCGAQIAAVAAPPPTYPPPYSQGYARTPRLQKHLQTLGVLWCVFGAYHVIAAVIGILLLGAVSVSAFVGPHWGWGWGWFNAFIPVIAVLVALMLAGAFVVGYGLLTRKSWARSLGIVVAMLSLVRFPIGTALGIYTLWVLIPAESAMEYEAIADYN